MLRSVTAGTVVCNRKKLGFSANVKSAYFNMGKFLSRITATLKSVDIT